MKVTVKDNYLNVRVGQPSVNAPCYQYIAPGSEIEVDGQFYKGDLYDGIDTWMKDAAGNYYWSGGVSINQSAVTGNNYNYNQLIQNIPDTWRNAGGNNVKVVIMDSGVSNIHNDIKMKSGDYFDFYYNGADKYDKAGHGTMVAGIIGASAAENGIRGIAPLCGMISYKTTTNTGGTDPIPIQRAIPALIQLASQYKIVIVNCSWNLDFSQAVDDLLKTVPQNVIFIAAAGNNNELLASNAPLYYPASLNRMISVGYINKDQFPSMAVNVLNPALDYVYIGSALTSCFVPATNSYTKFDQCSMATALTTGIVTLLASSILPGMTTVDVNLIRSQLNAQLLPIPSTNNLTDKITIYKLKS